MGSDNNAGLEESGQKGKVSRRQFIQLAIAGTAGAALAACSPPASTETPSHSTKANEPIPGVQTSTPDLDLVNPNTVATNMVATAQDVERKGEVGLIKEGFPQKILTSQRQIFATWRYEISEGDQFALEARVRTAGATAVAIPDSKGVTMLSILHAFDSQRYDTRMNENLQVNFPNRKITNNTLMNITVNGISLRRDQFGMSQFRDPNFNWDGVEGLVFIFIPYQQLDASQRMILENGAIGFDKLWFNEIPDDSKFYQICSPEDTTPLPVAMSGGSIDKTLGQTNNELYTTPMMSGNGCSGSGIGAVIDGNSYLTSVHVGQRRYDGYTGKSAISFKLSAIGQSGFLQKVSEASADVQN